MGLTDSADGRDRLSNLAARQRGCPARLEPPRARAPARPRQGIVSSATNAKKAIERTPFTVKKAASSRRRSSGRTMTCS